MAGSNRLFVSGYLLRESVASTEIGIDDGKARNEGQADETVNSGAGHDPSRNPGTKRPQPVNGSVRTFDLRGKGSLPSDKQDAKQREDRDNGEKCDHRRD